MLLDYNSDKEISDPGAGRKLHSEEHMQLAPKSLIKTQISSCIMILIIQKV